MRQRHVKPGYLPEAFYDYLRHLERCEAFANGKLRKNPTYTFSNQLFKDIPGEEELTARAVLETDAWLAKEVRSSVKFAVTMDTLANMIDNYPDEMTYILHNREFRLPYESCTLVITNDGHDDFVVAMNELRPGEYYEELGLESDEPFISMSVALWRKEGVEIGDRVFPQARLSYVPVEMHFKIGEKFDAVKRLFAIAPGIEQTEEGEAVMEMIATCVLTWLMSFHLSSVLRTKQLGVTPQQASHLAGRKKYHHKRKHPMYEHFVTELEVDDVEPSHTGVSRLQSRKRLHQVMGHPRHLRSGRTIWVKPHWRGDKKLGVVKRDFEVKLHETGE